MTPASVHVDAQTGDLVAIKELSGQPAGRRQVRVPSVGDAASDGLCCRMGSGVAAAVAEGATWRR